MNECNHEWIQTLGSLEMVCAHCNEKAIIGQSIYKTHAPTPQIRPVQKNDPQDPLMRGIDRFLSRKKPVEVKPDDAVEGVLHFLRPRVLERFAPGSCAATARAAQILLREFGVPAIPLPVRTQIYNPAAAKMIKAGKPLPDITDEAYDRLGIWGIALGHTPEELNLPDDDPRRNPKRDFFGIGHLGLLINHPERLDERPYFYDGSLDQATRPERDINLYTSILTKTTDEFLTISDPSDPDGYIAIEVDGSMVVYSSAPDDRRYLASPDWNNTDGRLDPVVFAATSDIMEWVARGKTNNALMQIHAARHDRHIAILNDEIRKAIDAGDLTTADAIKAERLRAYDRFDNLDIDVKQRGGLPEAEGNSGTE